MSKLTIVMYHYVRELENSRYPEIKGLDISKFEKQIEYLIKNYCLVTMEDVINSFDKNILLPPKAVLLTFDDGYIDHYENVFPLLNRYNIQGSFFVPAKAIIEHKLLDVNKIHFILAIVKDKKLLIEDIRVFLMENKSKYCLNDFKYYFNKLANESAFDSAEVIFIKRLLQVELPEMIRSIIINQLFEKYMDVSELQLAKELYMNKNQLQHMIRSGMHIGCHGYDHYWWNNLSEENLDKELKLSIKFLSELGVNMENWTACYPYGSFDEKSVKLLAQKKCRLALTTQVDIADTKLNSKHLLPRIDTNHLENEIINKQSYWYEKG
jgi:peptidoglycan/xylan/chitin deacetylase (PgdA/CDA1 family)